MVTSITIAGPKFSGKPGDWPDTKTEIVDAFNSAGAGFVNAMGELLFKYAGSGDHSAWEEAGLKKHLGQELAHPAHFAPLRNHEEDLGRKERGVHRALGRRKEKAA